MLSVWLAVFCCVFLMLYRPGSLSHMIQTIHSPSTLPPYLLDKGLSLISKMLITICQSDVYKLRLWSVQQSKNLRYFF